MHSGFELQEDPEKELDRLMMIIKDIERHSFEDRVFGSIMASFVADACSSLFINQTQTLSYDQVNESMMMLGGGPYQLGAGQVTDNSELMMCLIWGLTEANKEKDYDEERELNRDKLAHFYAKWMNTQRYSVNNCA